MVQEVVTPDNIATSCLDGPGIPVDKMLEGRARPSCSGWKTSWRNGSSPGRCRPGRLAGGSPFARRASGSEPAIGSFILPGPTGVGKTELTKALARFLFDDETALMRDRHVRIYGEAFVARLIGAPPGYVGYGGWGAHANPSAPALSGRAVRRDQKAHPDVFNVLLQVLDDGRLDRRSGATVDFKNTMIIMTSNLGAEYLTALRRKRGSDAVAISHGSGESRFPSGIPERVEIIILFHRLRRRKWARSSTFSSKGCAKLLADRKITLELEDDARVFLADRGYDPAYGARP